jgi:hypothetical protein
MLAQNFKTPADLGISDAEFEALLKVLRMMERGEIRAAPKDAVFDRYNIREAHTMFRMASTNGSADCGTACCILGWAWHLDDGMARHLFWETDQNPALNELFYTHTDGIYCRNPEQGAIALRNYLTFGEARWAEALAD